MASIATVVTRGYGSFGSVNLLPTIGYGVNQAVVIAGPYIVADVGVYGPGAQGRQSQSMGVFIPGASDDGIYQPGAQRRQRQTMEGI